jgi:hypothetical protein
VRIEAAELGMKQAGLANISLEVSDRVIEMVLERYGEVKEIQPGHRLIVTR